MWWVMLLCSLLYDTAAPHHDRLLAAWERRDAAGVAASLCAIGTPDDLVVPNANAGWLHEHPDVPYRTETAIGDFAILRAFRSLH